ncbi:MAG: c-type cytochrome [Planctomycetes bacterium]|nr:c-type cytochrome [Planctomycetota bacterium]
MSTEAPAAPQKDPVTSKSLSWPLAISSVLLVASTVWAAYMEVWGWRPWDRYQREFSVRYRSYLDAIEEDRTAYMKRIKSDPDLRDEHGNTYADYQRELAAEEKSTGERIEEIADGIALVNRQIAAVTPAMQDARAKVSALTWKHEQADHDGRDEEKQDLKAEIDEVSKGPFNVRIPTADGEEEKEYDYAGILKAFEDYKTRRDELSTRYASVTRRASEIRNRMDRFVRFYMEGLTGQQIEGLKAKLDGMSVEIRQIHVKDVGLIDRCESCHLGIREPLEIRAEDMTPEGQDPDEYARAFTSHPRRELLAVHDPDRFGCSPCHGGNGIATTSVKKAHGRHKFWLWPLFDKENAEAGCLQCHEGAIRMEDAPTLSEGLEIFRHNGCWGCHPRAGFDREREELKGVAQALDSIDRERFDMEREILTQARKSQDQRISDEDAKTALARIETLRLKVTGNETTREELLERQAELQLEKKDVAPNLKEIRSKLKPGWIPVWVNDPKAFRPSTRMPTFRLDMENRHLQKIVAYIWQSSLEPAVPKQEPGIAKEGKKLFESRGCQGCHAIGTLEDGSPKGGTFAAELSRVAEKATYDYLVRWIHNPRERSQPYCSTCRRDITKADYEAKGKLFVFDVVHANCPVCGSVMQVQNQTVMPDLRLTWQEARDVASYLVSLASADAPDYSIAPDWMSDPELAKEGKKLIGHYGCFSCHEIAGFEETGKIAPELTKEGSKPHDRLDFGVLHHDMVPHDERGWAEHKIFFEAKLANPAVFDTDKLKTDPLLKLKMPNFGFSKDQIRALSTFLQGSVDSRFPDRMYYRPAGPDAAIQDGWWVIQKYNCIGCHQIVPGEKPAIQRLPQYQGDRLPLAPPSLVGEGARVSERWLADFLVNPALAVSEDPDESNVPRNGVRRYLAVRMPTFTLSDGEVYKLVKFFAAMASQATPDLEPRPEELLEAEKNMARDAFIKGECLKCHVTDPAKITEETTAPSFTVAAERLRARWTARWMIDPAQFIPGTKMPTGLFTKDGDRFVLAAGAPDTMKDFHGDHVDLFVRYMQHFDDAEIAELEKRKK